MIRDMFECAAADPLEMDVLWAMGFRHFGTTFFRYDVQQHHEKPVHVIPLRINLGRFQPSRSQNRIIRRNKDLDVFFRRAAIDEEKERLFTAHKSRFKENVPDTIYNFFSELPAQVPCPALECCLFQENILIAAGFFDLGQSAVSSVYTFFDPAEAFGRRSLGIYVLLRQLQYAKDTGKTYLYPGYAYREPSFYDYKKNFAGLEYYDWAGTWIPLDKTGQTKTMSSPS